MAFFQRVVFALSRAGAFAAAVILLSMSGLILLEIVLRSVFASSTFFLEEMVGYGTAAITFLALGYALETGTMIRVGLLLERLNPAGRLRNWVEIVCIFATLSILSLAIWAFAHSVIRHYERGTDSGTLAATPLWIPEGLVLLGMVMFWIQLFAYLVRVISGRGVQPLTSIPSTFGP